MELELVNWLKSRLPSHPRLKLGIGDDAAVLALGERAECVVTVDLLAQGVDFEFPGATGRQIGHKALAVNLSDLAAMASRPIAALVALNLPRSGALELACELYEGMLPLAQRFGVTIAGGDTNAWDGGLVVSVTAIGQVGPRGVLTRSGARPGDQLLVTGALGGSLLGRHLAVEPRIDEALLLHENYQLHAGIDLSDGLALDLRRVCAASGCGVVLDAGAVPIASAAYQREAAEPQGPTALDHALGDGEDFELLLAVPPTDAERILADQPLSIPIRRIGQFTADLDLQLRTASGSLVPLPMAGWLH